MRVYLPLCLCFWMVVVCCLGSVAIAEDNVRADTAASNGSVLQIDIVNNDAGARWLSGNLKDNYFIIDPESEQAYILFTYDEMTIRCERAEINAEKNTGVLAGQVYVEQANTIITGGEMHADFEAEEYVVRNDVHITRYKEAGGNETGLSQREIEMQAWADEIRVWSNTKGIIASGNVRIKQDKMDMVCNQATYDDETGLLLMTGDVRIDSKDPQGTFTGSCFEVNTRDNTVKSQGSGKASIILKPSQKNPVGTEDSATADR